MARTEDDTWDLANSVGATATMVAAARAAATKRPHPVINDPFAEPLVRAVGIEAFNRLASGELDFEADDAGVAFPRITDTFAARARFYDDYLTQVTDGGIRQVVIVAAGLDSRAYRLAPARTPMSPRTCTPAAGTCSGSGLPSSSPPPGCRNCGPPISRCPPTPSAL